MRRTLHAGKGREIEFRKGARDVGGGLCEERDAGDGGEEEEGDGGLSCRWGKPGWVIVVRLARGEIGEREGCWVRWEP